MGIPASRLGHAGIGQHLAEEGCHLVGRFAATGTELPDDGTLAGRISVDLPECQRGLGEWQL